MPRALWLTYSPPASRRAVCDRTGGLINRAADERIEIGRLIDSRPMSRAQVLVIFLCALVMVVDGYDIQVMALAVPALTRDWNVAPARFGLALSAVVIGLTAGSGLLGPLADRFGRRTVLLASMCVVGLTTACTALAATPQQFVGWRLATGLALGAGIPSCAALTSEYAPAAYRSFLMGVLNIGSPLGAFAAGFVAPPILETLGWRGTFLVGGAAPLLLAALAIAAPESLKFLAIRRPASPRFARTLQRIVPGAEPAAIYAQHVASRTGAALLGPLRAPFRPRTLLLWALVALNQFNLYILVSWLPTLLQQSGWTLAQALRGAVLIQAGGVAGGLAIARLMDLGATRPTLASGFLLSGACLALFAVVPSGAAWVALLLLLGAGVSGSQLGINILSVAYYPPAIKATGVSWAIVVGGIGAVLGPLAGARFIDLQLAPGAILALLALPSLASAAGVLLMRREWQAH